MWQEVYADFLSCDMGNVIKTYSNPQSVLNKIKSNDKTMIAEVIGKVIERYRNWGKFSVERIMNGSALPIAISLIEI